jgi:exosortase/archaeosortase family protein
LLLGASTVTLGPGEEGPSVSMSESMLAPARSGVAGLRKFVGDVSPEDREVAHRARTVAILLAVVIVAYHYSFSTLLRTLNSQTPLAYLGLVPVIALALAFVRVRQVADEPAIHDRQVDYIVGLPMLIASLAINVLLPVRLSTMFWVWRVDLLALPLFIAGSIALLFGVRTLWRARLPIAFLFLAWPLPYTLLLMQQLQHFTDATLAGVRVGLAVMPIARPAAGSDGSLFLIRHGGHGFQVSVASACSGVNGLVGYALIAAAFLAMVRGSVGRKLAWLGLGLLTIWFLNVLRILMIFFVGNQWGERVAIDALHPYLGLFTFSIGVLIMLMVLRRFGLELQVPGQPPATAAAEVAGPTPTPTRTRTAVTVPKTRLAVSIVVAIGLLSGVANASLRSFDLVADSLGAPRLAAFLTHPGHPEDWRVSAVAQYDWAKPFFGENSKWYRYQFTWDGSAQSKFQTTTSVLADVISTDDLSVFNTYGIEACYNFHGYSLKSVNAVDLGGVVAHVLTYHNSAIHSDWTNVYWVWPVNTKDGTRYERINLMMIDSAKVKSRAPVPSASVARSLGIQLEAAITGDDGGGPQLVKTRAFLASFALDLVKHQKPAPKTATSG